MKNTRLLKKQTKAGANGIGTGDDQFKKQLLVTLKALYEGDFSIRLPGDLTGLDGKVADTFNQVAAQMEHFGDNISRLRNEAGRKEKSRSECPCGDAVGGWAERIEAINSLVDDLSRPTLEMGRVIGAVAKGDLSQSVPLEIAVVRCRANIFALPNWSTAWWNSWQDFPWK